MSFLSPFLLIHIDGHVDVYADLETLARAVREARILISTYHIESITAFFGKRERYTNNWIVRDDRGQIVTREAVNAALPYRRRYWQSRYDNVRHAEALGLPIPGTGRGHPYCYFRRFKFIGNNRARAAQLTDERGNFRTKKIQLMPSNWDDYGRADWYDRTWKRHRKTQYKILTGSRTMRK